MTRIRDDRGPLDALLSGIVDGVAVTDVMLFRGGPGSNAEKAYERARTVPLRQSERVALIEDAGVLTPAESQDWFDDAPERYAVLRLTKGVAFPKGPVANLFQHGQPSGFVIRGEIEKPVPPATGVIP